MTCCAPLQLAIALWLKVLRSTQLAKVQRTGDMNDLEHWKISTDVVASECWGRRCNLEGWNTFFQSDSNAGGENHGKRRTDVASPSARRTPGHHCPTLWSLIGSGASVGRWR